MMVAEIVADKALLPTMFSMAKVLSCLMRAVSAGVFGYFVSTLGIKGVFVSSPRVLLRVAICARLLLLAVIAVLQCIAVVCVSPCCCHSLLYGVCDEG